MKFSRKIFIILAAAVVGVVIFDWLRPKAAEYKTETARQGAIVEEVSETGSVKKGEAINLNFKTAGVISSIDVGKGDFVAAGRILAQLDDRQLQVQMAQARANLDLYKLQLEKIKRGASAEDINIIQSQAQSAQVARENAQKSLADARINADQKLNSANKTAADALSAAYIRAYNGYNFIDLLQRTYFAPQDDDSISVFETAQKISLAVLRLKQSADIAQAGGKDGGLDGVFANAKISLVEVESRLRFARGMCEKSPWRDSVSQTYKDSLDLHIGNMVAAQAAFNSAVEAIALQKAVNDLSINSAAGAADAALAAQKTAAGQLNKIEAAARAEDVGILEAQAAQARAQVALLELQIADSKLIAPADGQVSEINGAAGETVSPLAAAPLMVFLPADPYEVELDIYEEEAVKLSVGDPARISVVALGDEIFSGKVVFIAPAGRIINGVVYYRARIAFDGDSERMKPDMTADVEIVTAQKDNVLLVSESALRRKDGGWYARVVENGVLREVAVQAGIRAKGLVEIISGLAEGDQVIIP